MRTLLFIILLIPALLFGAEKNIWVDGKSGGDGSPVYVPYGNLSDIKWDDITKWVADGDTVFINLMRGVTWKESFWIQASGVKGRPITIRPFGIGAKPIIDGGSNIDNSTDYHPVKISSQSYITIDGLDVRHGNKSNIVISSWFGPVSNIIIKNCVSRNSLELGGIVFIGNSTIYENRVTNCLVVGNTVYQNKQHGIGFFYNVEDITVRKNISHHNGWGGTSASTGGHGFTSWAADGKIAPNNLTFEYNVAYNNYSESSVGLEGSGFQFDDNTYNSVMRHNISYDNEGYGFIDNGDHSGNIFVSNTAYGNKRKGFYSAPQRNSFMSNNEVISKRQLKQR